MISVDFLPNGAPVDPKYFDYCRFFNGSELLVFDDFDEYNEFINKLYPPIDENIINNDADS